MTKTERIAFFSLAILVWIYLGLRSVYIPLIHDETVTYYLYIQSANFIPPWAFWDANNHILNSGLSAFFNAAFGHSPFVARLASWLSFLPFVYFVGGICKFIEDKWQKWAVIITLFSTPFFIEFFSLTRGYGMAMTWFLGALFFAMLYVKTRIPKYLYLLSLSGLLATLSSLSVIIAVFIIFGWVVLYRLVKENEKSLLNNIATILLLYIPQLPLVYYGFILKEKGLLYYGGDDVISYSLRPFARYFLNAKELWWIFALAVIFLVVFFGLRFLKKGLSELFDPIRVFPFVLILSVVAVFAQHFLLDVNYPEDRAALYFFPLIIISWVTIPSYGKLKYAWLIPLIWFPIDLVTSANIEYSKLWPNEHVPTRFWQKVNDLKEEYPASMSAYFLRHGIWNYHSLDRGFSTSPNSVEHPSEWADVLLVDSVRVKQVDGTKYKKLDYDEISGQTLLKREPNLLEVQIMDSSFVTPIQNLYTNVWEFKAGNLVGNALALYYDFELKSKNKIVHLNIITSVFDTLGNEIHTIKYDLSLVSEHWDQTQNWRVKQFLPPLPANSGRFVSYIYNPFEEQYASIKMSNKITRLTDPGI